MFRVFCRIAVVLALFLYVAGANFPVLAQSTVTGAVSGTVRDPQEAIIPNATVTVRNEGTNQEQTATTDDEGRFRVTQLQPGNYTVTINSGSFAAFTQPNVVVEVGQITPLDITLGIAGSTAQVDVSAEAPVINVERQDFATNINQTSINELPINGRRANNFALLTPATVPDGNFGLISFRGISGLLNNNTVDGGDNNQAFFSEERGRTRISYTVSQASIREFQVNTSNYSAEYGRAAGGVVNQVTKSGTNEFHGQVFYYNRNNRLGARNPLATRSFFDAATGIRTVEGIKPKDVRQQFGGNVGGPIVKNRLFFFFNYDQQERNFPGLAIFNQPDFLTRTNRTLLTTGRAAGRVIGLTNAQVDTSLSFLNSLTGEVPRRADQKIFFPKIDFVINENNTFTASYNRLRSNSPSGIQTQPTNTRGRASFGDDFVEIDFLNLRLNSTISSALLNEARFQYGRDNEFQFSNAPLQGEPATGLNGRSPSVFITGGLEFGKPDFLERRAFPDERRIQFADTVTYSFGNQTLKFGADFNRVRDDFDNLRFEGGAYSYNNINDFIVDYTNFLSPLAAGTPCATQPTGATVPTRLAGRCYTSNYQQGFGPTAFRIDTTNYDFFIQDDIRFTPRLTINLGLRYEYQKNPDPQLANTAAATFGNTVIANLSGRTLADATSFIPSDKNNFGPRVGFAYDLSGDGKTSLRGGLGVYYGRIQNSTIANAITNTGAAGAQRQITVSPTSSAAPIFPNVLAAPTAGTTDVQFFAEDFQAPRIVQGDLIIEREIARNTVVSASFLTSYGRALPNFIDRNLNFPTATRTVAISGGPFDGQSFTLPFFTGTRPNPNFGRLTQIRSDIRSQYHALVLQANRRFTDGLQFQASYTLSQAEDSGQTSTTFTSANTAFDAFDLNQDRGRSNLDVPHKVVVSAVYTPDFFGDQSDQDGLGRAIFNGFNIAPIFSYYSGRPFSAAISGTSGGTGGGINGSGGINRLPNIISERNSFRQPPIINFDLRVSRRFNLGEERSIELLAEGFNIFNRTQVTNVNTTLYNFSSIAGTNNGTLSLAPNVFGATSEAGGTLFRERQVQLAIRFEF